MACSSSICYNFFFIYFSPKVLLCFIKIFRNGLLVFGLGFNVYSKIFYYCFFFFNRSYASKYSEINKNSVLISLLSYIKESVSLGSAIAFLLNYLLKLRIAFPTSQSCYYL